MTYLDKTDFLILSYLREDSRLPLKKLASIANISIPTAGSRILRLKNLGIIKQLTASIEIQPITNIITSFISIKSKLPNIKKMIEKIKDMEEVSEAYLTTGQYDIILKVHVPDMQTLNKLLTDKLSVIEGIETISSSFIIETVLDLAGPVLRPNLGFKIKCDECGKIVGEEYVKKEIDKKNQFFCQQSCFLDSTRKS